MAAVGMMIVVFMLIIGSLIYLIISALICVSLSKNKKTRLLYFALFLSLPLLVATLNYYGFCFKKMRFLNEQDIYTAIDNSEYRNCKNTEKLNICYGTYVISDKKFYGYFKTDIEGDHLYSNFWTHLERVLGQRYAHIQIQKSNQFLIISNCGNILHRDF